MKITKTHIISLFTVIISFGLAIWFYPQMPEMIASHWGTNGAVNGYMPRFWGLFIMPIVSLFMLVMFIVLPSLDPKKHNIEKFRKYFDNFIVMIFLFMLYIYILTLAWNLGVVFDMILYMIPALAVLFYYCGVLIEHSEPNWTVGIRTPWTLESKTVWKKTHALGGKLFKATGLVALLGILFPQLAIWFILFPAIFAAVFVCAYSYVEYKKEQK